MTSPNRTRVDALPQVGEIGGRSPVSTEVRSSPVGARGARLDAGTDQLVRGLAALEPSLNAFIAQKGEEERVAGMKARATQQSSQVVIPEGSAEFQRGYMEMHGQVAGMGAARKMREAYEANKGKPDFDVEGELQKIVADETKGLTDKDALKGFLPALVRERESIRNEHSKFQLERLRSDNDQQLQARARDVAERSYSGEELVGTTPSQLRHAEYQQFVERGLALGKTRPELAEAFTRALVNQALTTQDPSVLDVAAIRDKSGIALIDNPVQGKAILEARKHAQELQKKSVYESGTQYRTDTLLDLEETLRSSPNSSKLDLDSLKQHAHQYGLFNDHDGKELAAFYRRVVEAREKNSQLLKLRDDLFGPNGRIAAARPESKPLIDAEYDRLWQGWQQSLGQGQDDRATQAFIMLNLSRHQQWGVPDQRLKSLLSNINTEPSKDGKPSPDFQRAYAVYSAIMDSPNKDLIGDLTDERSRTLLHHFRGMIVDEKRPSAEAFAAAKDFTTPAVQERLKAINTEKVRTEFDTELRSRLKKGDWYTFGLTGKAANDGQFLTTLNDVFHRKLALLGNVDAAKKQTLDMIPQYLARDSNDSWTPRPDENVLAAHGGTQRAFEAGLKAYTSDLGETLQTEAKALGRDTPVFALDRMGQGDAYIVRVNGIPAGRVELSEILQRGQATYVTAEQAQTLTGLAKRIKMNDGRQMSDEEIDANWGSIYQLYGLGKINANQLDKLSTRRQSFINERLSKAEKEALQAKKDALGGINPKDILSEPQGLPEDPAKQPGGKNLRTADYAAQALQSGNLTYALTAQAEGVMFRRHKDPSKGENIGVGFSLTSRSKPEVLSMLRRAGVASSDVEAVFDGKMEVSPKVVERLHAIAVPEYQKKAIAAVGADAWRRMTPEAQAVLTDMAWVTGKPSQFTAVLDSMRKGDWDGASAALSLKYTDRNTGEQKDDVRRVNLWRLMLSGRKTYADYLSKHTTK